MHGLNLSSGSLEILYSAAIHALLQIKCSAMSKLYMSAHMKFSEGSINSIGEHCIPARCCKLHPRSLGMAGAQVRLRNSPVHLSVAAVIVWQVEVLEIPVSFLQLVLTRHMS